MFSLRTVNVDHYLSTPIPGVDVTYSDFRCCRVKKVPVVRVFGATPAGQKTCLHLHGIFPYICVPCDGSPLSSGCEKELNQLAVSLDRALNISLGKSSTTDAQHVYKVSLVSGTPFYGYHSKEQHFYKIYFYNPLMVKRAVELLQSGAVLNKAFQPHEAHVPFILQMFIDYNLYGMNLLNLASVKFRKWKKNEFSPVTDISWNETTSDLNNSSFESNSNFPDNQNSYPDVKFRKWIYNLIPDALFLSEEIERQSICELEVDALASDILNRMELMSNPGMNPGLKFIWEDEKLRRQNDGKSLQPTPTTSQDRGEILKQTTELRYLEKLKNMLNQSENKSCFNDLPLDLSNNNVSTVCVKPSRSQEMHTPKERDESQSIASNKIEPEAVVNEDLVLSLSQSLNNSQHGCSILDTQDEELIDVLAKMCSSQATLDGDSILSTQTPIQTWDQTNKQFDDADDVNEEEETKEMSQLIWDTDPNIVTETLPQVDGPVDPKQTHSGLNRPPRFRMPVSQTQLSATSGMRLKTARKSTYTGSASTLHPIPSPVTNHPYRGSTWPHQMQAMPPVPQNFLYQNHQHPGPMHWNYRDYNMWHPMEMGSTTAFPPNTVGMDEQKKLMPPGPCWPSSSTSGQAMGSNCREFSAMNPFSDGYPSMHYNRQERLPSLNMPSCLATPPGGFYEPHSFIPPLNYNCEMAMPKECIKYQQQQQQHQQQQFMAAGNAFNCMESAMNGNQKNFISLQRISYVSKDYQLSWQDEVNRNEQDLNYYSGNSSSNNNNNNSNNNNNNNNQAEAIIMSDNNMPVNVRTACSDVLAAAMSSSGIDMHSLAEVCEEEEQCVEFTDRPINAATTSSCRLEESSVMVVAERDQRISAVTKHCKTSVVSCIPNTRSFEEGNNENWIEETPVWLVDVKESERVEYGEELGNVCEDETDESKEDKLEGEEKEKEEEKGDNESRKYVLPDLSSIIESEELFDEQGNEVEMKLDEDESDLNEKMDESPNLQLSDISEEDSKEFEENLLVDQYQDNKVDLSVTEDVKLVENENENEELVESKIVDEELLSGEEMSNVILIELNENEELMVLDVNDEKEEMAENEMETGCDLDGNSTVDEKNSCLQVLDENSGGETSLKGNSSIDHYDEVKTYRIVQSDEIKSKIMLSDVLEREKLDEKPVEKLNENSVKPDEKLMGNLDEMQNLTEKPKIIEVLVEKAKENEVLDEKPKESEVLVDKAKQNEFLVEKAKQNEVLTEKPKDNEVVTKKPNCKEVLVEKPNEKEVILENPNEKKVILENPKEKEVTLENPKEKEVTLENSKEKEILVENRTEKNILLEKTTVEISKEQEKEIETLLEKPTETQIAVEIVEKEKNVNNSDSNSNTEKQNQLNTKTNVNINQETNKSITFASTTLPNKPRTPVLEKMASLVRKALSNLHDRELMTDLTIGTIDSNSCITPSSSGNKHVPSAYEQQPSRTCKKSNISSQSNGSLAGKGTMKRASGSKKKNKLDVQTVPVRTRTVGTNVHPQDLPRRRSGHLYLVRYHGLRVTVDEKGLEDLKKLGKERVCVRKLKTDVAKVSDYHVERKRTKPTKKWTLQRNGDVCEGLKMRFKADKNSEEKNEAKKKEKNDLSVAQGRERRLKVDYKPHAFSHIFKFDVMPERDDIQKRKVNKNEAHNNDNSKASLKLLLKKKDVKKKMAAQGEKLERRKSFDWSISQMDSFEKIESKTKSKSTKSNKPPLTLIESHVKNEKKKPNVEHVVGKKSTPQTFDEKEKMSKDVVWTEEIEPCEEILTPPPPCWSPNQSKVYEDLKPLEAVNDGLVEENGNLDEWLPFGFTVDDMVTEDNQTERLEQLKMEENVKKTNDKPVLIHRCLNFSEDSDLFSDSSADVLHMDEKDCSSPSPNMSESEQKDASVSINLSDDDFCMQSEDEMEVRVREPRDELMMSEDENFEDSLMMSDLSEDENNKISSLEKTRAENKFKDGGNLSTCSQDLFPLSCIDTCDDLKESDDDRGGSVHSDDLFVVTDQPTPENENFDESMSDANSPEMLMSSCDENDSLITSGIDSLNTTESKLESLPSTITPDCNQTLGIDSFYCDNTPETPTFMNNLSNKDSDVTLKDGEKIYTWHCPPPSRKEVEESWNVYRHTKAHFSRDEDGRSEPVENFQSKFANNGLDNWRAVLCAASSDESCKDILEEMKTNPKIRLALASNRKVIITPNLKPPSRREIEEWARKKIAVNKNQNQTETKIEVETETEKIPSCRVFSPSVSDFRPQHSTPNARHIRPNFSPAFTPILKKRKRGEREEDNPEPVRKRMKRLVDDWEMSEKKYSNSSKKSFQDTLKLPGRMLPFSSCDLKEQKAHSSNTSTSQISGPSLTNSHGFKVTYDNLKDAKSVHEYQFLTLFSFEIHSRTRRNLRPDPKIDPICAVFYSIYNDVPENKTVNREIIGCIAVLDNQTTKTTECTCNKEISLSGISKCSSCRQLKRHLAARTGVVNIKTIFVSSEMKLIDEVVDLVRKCDPDILVGYELETSSWGFLLQRARFLKLDLESSLSRIPKLKSDTVSIPTNETGIDGEEVQIKGRIVLNLWHLMRREVALTSYRFENIAYHILHQRIPLYSFRNLSDWFDHHTDLYRWRTIEHYIIRCHANIRLLMQVDFIGRTSELARLFGIQFYEVLSRGSQFRVESMMLRLAKPLNYVAVSPSVQQRAKSRAPQCLALILEPESKFYTNPVLVLDFQSLYPSMIIAYNYCYSTCLGHIDSLQESELFKFGCTSLSIPPNELKELSNGSNLHISPTGNVYVNSNIRKGVIPQMLEEILETRIMVKKAMKNCKDDKSLTKVLDARQLGLKLIANVTYGYTAANYSGRMPCSEVADSVVGKAREALERAIQMVHSNTNWNAKVVYGDTDSLFVHLPGRSKSDAFKIGQEIADAVTAANPKPVKLKFEKVYLPCVLETKKRYVGFMYETPDQEEPVFDAKGIETVRRDRCPVVVKVLEKSLRILFTTRDLSKVKSYVQRQFQKIFAARVSLQDFTLAREYRGRNLYKPNACVPALELAKRLVQEDPRAEPLPGDRVPYVIVYGSPGAPLFQLVRRPDEVLLDTNLRINAHYYVNNLLIPSLQRVFGLLDINVSQWFTSMSRINNNRLISGADRWCSPKKGTISQYFSLMSCPGCGDTNSKDLCAKCRADPQTVVVSLSSQIQKLERNHHHLTNICESCTGNREKISCISLDCPVFYSLAQASKDLNRVHYLRKNIDFLF